MGRTPKGQPDIEYKGLKIRWTNWKTDQNGIRLIAQWAAPIGDGFMFWAGTNGNSGKSPVDAELNIYGNIDGPITIFSTQNEKNKAKHDALANLIKLIDEMIPDANT